MYRGQIINRKKLLYLLEKSISKLYSSFFTLLYLTLIRIPHLCHSIIDYP